MLVDQLASDLVHAASFGRPAIDVGIDIWGYWASYLLPIASILVPKEREANQIVTTDALTFFSQRVHLIDLPNDPRIGTIVDMNRTGISPREWLIQELSKLPVSQDFRKDDGVGYLIENSIATDIKELSAEDRIEAGNQRQITIELNGAWLVDPRIMPAMPCYCCDNDDYWQRPDGGWVCSTCHPKPTI